VYVGSNDGNLYAFNAFTGQRLWSATIGSVYGSSPAIPSMYRIPRDNETWVGFDLKTFRSTYATRMLRQGFDVRTVQDWMGHKSLETTMRYLVPATDVHDRLDEIEIPGITESAVPKKAPGSERQLVFSPKKMRR